MANTGSAYVSAYERMKEYKDTPAQPLHPASTQANHTIYESFNSKYPFVTDKNALALAQWIEKDLRGLGFSLPHLLQQYALQGNYIITVKKKYSDNPHAKTGRIQYSTRIRLGAMRDAVNHYIAQHNAEVIVRQANEKAALALAPEQIPLVGTPLPYPKATMGKPTQEDGTPPPNLRFLEPETPALIHHAISEAAGVRNPDVENLLTRIQSDTLGIRKTLALAATPELQEIHDLLVEIRDLMKAALG